EALRELMKINAQVLDVRSKEAFATGHVPGAINIPVGPNFPTWAGWLLDYEAPIALVCDDAKQAREAAIHLIRIGLDNMEGYVDAVALARTALIPLQTIPPRQALERLERACDGDRAFILDVRSDAEFAARHIDSARHIPL